MLITNTVQLSVVVIMALARFEHFPPLRDLIWGVVACLLGIIGLGALLRGFAIGRMGIVAPVSAVLATGLPVVFASFSEGLPRQIQMLGFGLALVSIWLLSRPERFGGAPAGLGMALLAGLGFGGFFVALDQIGEGALFWPLAAGRLIAAVLMVFFAFSTRRPLFLPTGSSEWTAGHCRGIGFPLPGSYHNPGQTNYQGEHGTPPGGRHGDSYPGDCADHSLKTSNRVFWQCLY